MAASNPSRDVSGHHGHSGSTSRPPLPPSLPTAYICRPVPFWERKFCYNAYDVPWKTFCENKRLIALHPNVLDWDDSGALKNFKDAKKRFRAKHYGEAYADPVLDPDMYIDEVDHDCKVDSELVAELDTITALGWGGMDDLTPTGWGGGPVGNLIPLGWGQPIPNLTPTGWGEPSNLTPAPAWGGQGNQTPEGVLGAHPHCTPNNRNSNFHGGGSSSNWHQQEVGPGQTSSGTGMLPDGGVRIWTSGVSGGGAMRWNGGSGNGSGRNWNGGSGGGGGQREVDPGHKSSGTGRMLNSVGRMWTSCVGGHGGGGGGGGSGSNGNGGGHGGSGRGSNWNCGGRGNQRNQDEGQHQQRSGGGMQRNQDEGRHQMRSGGGQQQGQGARKMMVWRPVQHNRTPKDGPAA